MFSDCPSVHPSVCLISKRILKHNLKTAKFSRIIWLNLVAKGQGHCDLTQHSFGINQIIHLQNYDKPHTNVYHALQKYIKHTRYWTKYDGTDPNVTETKTCQGLHRCFKGEKLLLFCFYSWFALVAFFVISIVLYSSTQNTASY